jgi:agmatine/peptidylarginine deiminase
MQVGVDPAYFFVIWCILSGIFLIFARHQFSISDMTFDIAPFHYYLPAEWHPQEAIMLTWPHKDTDWAPYLEKVTATFVELARAIVQREKLLIVAQDVNSTRQLIRREVGVELASRVSYAQCPTNDTWARDHGPLTLISPDGGEPLLLDFKFNGWGEKFNWQKDNDITRRAYEQHLFTGRRIDLTDFVLEGGSIETDGKGTLFTTAACLLAPHRNQPMTEKEIDLQLRRLFQVERVVWLRHGHLIGDDTDGHIDTLVRTAPDDTLVYVGPGPENDEQHEELAAMEQELQQLTTLDGHPYRLLRLPLPDPVYYEGERLPATYANYVIINGAVIVPTYHQPKHDAEALRIVAEAYPGREVVAIDASVVVRQHGSLHCLTMQTPITIHNS